MESDFEKLRFLDGLMWTVGLTVEIKLRMPLQGIRINNKEIHDRLWIKLFANWPFHRFWRHLAWGANAAKLAVNVWEKLKVWCPTSWEWLTFWLFYELQGKDTQQKVVLVKFEEHRFAVRREIALLIFLTNVSKFSRESQFDFTDKRVEKWKP